MSSIVDTHCHLNFNSYDEDRMDVLMRARAAGVEKFLIPGVDLDSCHAAVALSQEHTDVFAAVGVHPNNDIDISSAWIDGIRGLASKDKVVAIGEIGLDYYRDVTGEEIQIKILQEQLSLAEELCRPVVIHLRDKNVEDQTATNDLLGIIKTWINNMSMKGLPLIQRPGVFHSFSGDADTAMNIVDLNFFIGISGPVTFKNADRLHRVVSEVPVGRLLPETDSPFLTPHPFRGQRNEPANVRYVVQTIAEIKNMSYEAVAEATTLNAEELFQWRVTN